jgi:6,7-dimethyl-8-ribityllumazine synthase
MAGGMRILIVEARFYNDITDHLVRGAIQELAAVGAGYKRIIVPGVYEIPAAIRYAIRAMELRAVDERYAGYIAIGCAIKGETDHYEHICNATMRGIQDLVIQYTLALGNGILTCQTEDQAVERASVEGRNFGGQAARACLRMIDVKRELHLTPK